MFLNIILPLLFILLLSPVVVITQAQQQDTVQHVPCVDWETTATAFTDAFAGWTDPACYTFSFNYTLKEMIKGAVTRTVKHGKQIENGPFPEIDFLNEFWYWIQRDCIQDCPASGAHTCEIEYDTSDDGSFVYPSSLYIHHNSTDDSDTSIYNLFNVTSLDCSAIQVRNATADAFVNEPCTNWEFTAATYEQAYPLWKAPLCYTFTYTIFQEFFLNETYTVTVQNGTSVSITGDPTLQTLDDFWNLIQTKCIQDCPTLGAHFCDIECAVTNDDTGIVYPTFLLMDQDSRFEAKQLMYLISNVSAMTCPGEEEEEPNGGDDANNQSCDFEWNQAKAKWSSPACYNYSVGRDGMIFPEFRGPFTLQVRNGIVTNGNAMSVNMTLDDMFALIEEKCVIGCPDTVAFQCSITYDAEFGFPTAIYIDYDELMIDEELIYIISDFQSVACDSENADDDDVAATMCQNWEQLRDTLDAMEENWNDPPCYQYTITENEETPVIVHVRDSIVVSPNTSETLDGTLAPETLSEFIAGIRSTCVDGCPSMGVANCDFESSGNSPIGNWIIATNESTSNFNISDYEVVSCDKEIVKSDEDTSASSVGSSITIPIRLIVTAAFLFY